MQKAALVIVLTIGMLFPQLVEAQGVLYVSNLGQTPIGSGTISSNSWVAQIFATGSNAGGYLLNSIQLLMNAASGTPGGFSISIYSKTGDPHSLHVPGDIPQTNLGVLIGSSPVTGGLFGYANTGIILSPSTFYCVVVTAATPVDVGEYSWSAGNTLTQSNGFSIQNSYFGSTNGSNWIWQTRGKVFQLGIYASAVPPPNLKIVPNGSSGLSIQWPNLGSYVLLQNTNLASTNWLTSDYPVTNNVLTNFCTVTPTTGSLFFRLKQ